MWYVFASSTSSSCVALFFLQLQNSLSSPLKLLHKPTGSTASSNIKCCITLPPLLQIIPSSLPLISIIIDIRIKMSDVDKEFHIRTNGSEATVSLTLVFYRPLRCV